MAKKSRGIGERIEDRLLREGKATEQRRKKKVEQEIRKFKKCISLFTSNLAKKKTGPKTKISSTDKSNYFTIDNFSRPKVTPNLTIRTHSPKILQKSILPPP